MNNGELVSIIGSTLGFSSTFCWFIAQLPQILLNYRTKDVKALSLPFLVIWAIADAANLVGCLLTDQLMSQKAQAIYFVFIDFVFTLQYVYYSSGKKKEMNIANFDESTNDRDFLIINPTDSNDDDDDDDYDDDEVEVEQSKSQNHSSTRSILLPANTLLVIFILVAGCSNFGLTIPSIPSTPSTTSSPSSPSSHIVPENNIKDDTDNSDRENQLGIFFAWFCTSLYLTSRIPQIIKNYNRKSVKGLCLSLFACAVIANILYATSIFIQSKGNVRVILNALPYLLGSLGTLILDSVIFIQFKWYSINDN